MPGNAGNPNSMKILMITDRMNTGGAETHIETLATELLRLGHSVTVFSAGGRIADRMEAAGVRQVRCRLPRNGPLCRIRFFLALRREVRHGQYNVLHAHTRMTGFLLAHLPSKAARIVTVHAAKFGFPTARMCKNATVIAVSEDLRTGLLSHTKTPAECIHVIPNGIDLCRFSPPVEPPPPHSLLFASRLDPDCARVAELLPEVIPDLLGQFPDLCVTIAGGGSMLERIRLQAEELNRRVGREILRAVGPVDDMPALFRSHRVVIGVSRVALEAVACDCAVLLAGNEGYGGILRTLRSAPARSNFCCRGSEPVSPGTLCADLRRILADPPPSLRSEVAHTYSAQSMGRSTEALYLSLLPPVYAKKPIRLLVGGYAGCGNLGDDAILQGLIVRLRKEHPEVRLRALTGSPVRDSRRFGIPCVHRLRLPSVALAMLRSDIFLLGGGSLLQDLTGKRSLAYYLFLLKLARFLGCRTGTLAAGIGPLRSAHSEHSVLQALCACEVLTLRDEDSRRFLILHGAEPAKVRLVPDPAEFLPPPPPLRSAAILSALGLPDGTGYFCVSVRPTQPPGHQPLAVLATAVRRISAEHGLTPVFPVLDPACDLPATREIIRLSDCGGKVFLPDEASDLPSLLSGAVFLLSMRLHALLFAGQVGTPAIAVSPGSEEVKLASFSRHAGIPHFCAHTLSVVSLCAEIETTIKNNSHS